MSSFELRVCHKLTSLSPPMDSKSVMVTEYFVGTQHGSGGCPLTTTASTNSRTAAIGTRPAIARSRLCLTGRRKIQRLRTPDSAQGN